MEREIKFIISNVRNIINIENDIFEYSKNLKKKSERFSNSLLRWEDGALKNKFFIKPWVSPRAEIQKIIKLEIQ